MPEQAYLRLGDDRPDTVEVDLKLLYGIYTYEATRVSGTHGGLKRFSDCMWSVDDAFTSHMVGKLNRPWDEIQPDFENLVTFLSSPDQRHMMRFEKEGVMYHLSRLAESIRTSGNLHEFQNREVPDEDGEDVSMKFNIIEERNGTQSSGMELHASFHLPKSFRASNKSSTAFLDLPNGQVAIPLKMRSLICSWLWKA